MLRETHAEACRASDLRRRDQDRGRRGHPRLLGRGRPPYRGAARRSRRAASASAISRTPGGYANAADLVSGLKAHRAVRDLGRRLSGEASREPVGRGRHRHIEGQDRCRRDTRHHPVLLRQRAFSALPGPRARARGIWVPIVPGIVPIHNFKQVAGFATAAGASVPAWLARRFDGLDDDPETRHLVAARGRHRAGDGPRRSGHQPSSTSIR